MNFSQSNIWLPVLLFILTLAFGIWLSRSGRPLNILVFTIHKLIALGGVIFAGLAVYNWLKQVEPQGVVIAMIAILGASIIALFISGAFLSRDKPVNKALLIMHGIMPVLAALSAIYLIYLMGM